MKQQLISYLHWKNLLLPILFLSTGISRAQDSYLLEHAVCFSNGTHIYQENGKYGFRNFEKRLTKPVYDTIFQFGKNYSVVKNGDNYSILGKDLESRFNETIIHAERNFDNRFSKYIQLKLVTAEFDTLVYTISTKDDQPIVYHDSEAWKLFRFYEPVIENKRPVENVRKVFDPNNYTYVINEYEVEKWVDSIRVSGETNTIYLQNGKVLNLDKIGYFNYLGRYYFNLSYDEKVLVVDIVTGDTILRLPAEHSASLIQYKNLWYFEVFGSPGKLKTRTLYALDGKLISSTASSLTLQSNHGVLQESFNIEIDKPQGSGVIEICNLRHFISAELILENVIELEHNANASLYKAQNRSVFYLLENGDLIDSIVTDKKMLYLTGESWLDEPGNRLVAITDSYSSQLATVTYLLSTRNHFRTELSGYNSVYYNSYYQTYTVHYYKYNRKKPSESVSRMGLYNEKSNTILFANENEARYQIGPTQFITGDSIYSVVDFSGKLLMDKSISVYDDYEIGEHRYVSLFFDRKNHLYNEQFELICEDCKLQGNTLKRSGDPGYKLVNSKLETMFDNGKFIVEWIYLNNSLVVLNTDKTIDYFPIPEFDK